MRNPVRPCAQSIYKISQTALAARGGEGRRRAQGDLRLDPRGRPRHTAAQPDPRMTPAASRRRRARPNRSSTAAASKGSATHARGKRATWGRVSPVEVTHVGECDLRLRVLSGALSREPNLPTVVNPEIGRNVQDEARHHDRRA
jgi:hypothetical protein